MSSCTNFSRNKEVGMMRLFREDNDCGVMKGELLKIKLIGKFVAALNSEPNSVG